MTTCRSWRLTTLKTNDHHCNPSQSLLFFAASFSSPTSSLHPFLISPPPSSMPFISLNNTQYIYWPLFFLLVLTLLSLLPLSLHLSLPLPRFPFPFSSFSTHLSLCLSPILSFSSPYLQSLSSPFHPPYFSPPFLFTSSFFPSILTVQYPVCV